jgi:hypothetical protein
VITSKLTAVQTARPWGRPLACRYSPIVRARGARDTIGISRGRKAEARYDRKWKSDAESELVVVIFESVVINVVPPAVFASES